MTTTVFLQLVTNGIVQGASLIATPEGSNILQKDRAKLFPALKSLEDDPFVQGMRAAAKDLGVWILIGSALVKREARRIGGNDSNEANATRTRGLG